MIKKIKMEVEVEAMDAVVCDKCGKEFLVEEAWEEIRDDKSLAEKVQDKIMEINKDD